ncbi:unnamed protein product [Urochloa decumbens]|uniref:Glycolipid transfer protein domain-containing protein n=1 Tax=Urochloa decumbens TaxID=240449 RepID=A0ABC9FIU7_9POAL
MQMEGTVFTPSLEGMKHVKSESGVILTKPFLEVCKHILPVLEKFGSAMSIVKTDIGGNITRLEKKYASDPTKYEQLHSMVKLEVAIKLAPDRKKFMEIISGSGDIDADIEKFYSTFSPLLAENHKFLASVGMDDLKAS